MQQEKARDIDAKDNAFNRFDDATYQYQTADVNYVGHEIFKAKSCTCHFVGAIGSGAEQISGQTILRQALQKQRADNKKLVGVFNLGNFHWIAFVIIGEGEQLRCICKDSMKDAHSEKKVLFESFISKLSSGIICVYHDGNEQTDGTSCGVFALKNAEILVGMEISAFLSPSNKFCMQSDIRE